MSLRFKALRVSLLALASVLFVGILGSGLAYADPVAEMTDQEILQHLRSINDKYDVGEPFEAEDATFVLNHATNPNDPVPYGTHNVNMSGGLYGTNVTVTGSVYHNGTVTYTYGGTLVAKKTSGSTPKKYVTSIRCTSYGIAGSGGVIKIYDDKVTATKLNSNSFTANLSESYVGYMFSYALDPSVVVTTPSGDVFTVRA